MAQFWFTRGSLFLQVPGFSIAAVFRPTWYVWGFLGRIGGWAVLFTARLGYKRHGIRGRFLGVNGHWWQRPSLEKQGLRQVTP